MKEPLRLRMEIHLGLFNEDSPDVRLLLPERLEDANDDSALNAEAHRLGRKFKLPLFADDSQ